MAGKKIFDYSNIAEKIYSRSFIAVCAFISFSLFLAWQSGEDLAAVLSSILTFIEHVLWVYAVPVSIQIAGDKFALVLKYLKGR